MFVLIAILLGILIGVIRKGKLSGLFRERPTLWFLCFLGLLIQLGLHLLYYTGADSSLIPIVHIVSYLMVIMSLLCNLRDVWSIVLTAGFTVNFAEIVLNGGAMPVSSDVLKGTAAALAQSITSGSNAVYVPMDSATTRLWFLGDVLCIPKVGAVTGLYGAVPSIAVGTLAILIGLIGWIQETMVLSSSEIESDSMDAEDFEEGTNYEILSSSIFLNEEEADEYDYAFFQTGKVALDEMAFEEDEDALTHDDEQYMAEEIYTAATASIPRLTPETFDEIRRNSLAEANELLNEVTSDKETRVYTSLSNLNEGDVRNMTDQVQYDFSNLTLFDVDEDQNQNQNPGIHDSEQKTVESSHHETYTPQWDWKKPAAKGAVDLAAKKAVQNAAAGDLAANAVGLTARQALRAGRKQTEWNPKEIERNTYAEPRQILKSQRGNPYSTLFNTAEKKGGQGRSIDEMRNIWHQASENDKRRRKSAESDLGADSTGTYTGQEQPKTDLLPEDDSSKRQSSAEPVVLKSAYEQALEEIGKKWDEKKPSSQLKNLLPKKSTERVDSKEILRKTLTERSEKKVTDAIIKKEREQAGYEKVELPVEDRIISFWRKRK